MKKNKLDPELLRVMQTLTGVTGERNAALAAVGAMARATAKMTQQRDAALGGKPLPWIPVPPPELGQAMRLRLEQAARKGEITGLEDIAGDAWNRLHGKPCGVMNVLIVMALMLAQVEKEMREVMGEEWHTVEEAALGLMVFARHYVQALSEMERGPS